jgi:mannose-1-phosphate guanylyltransferase / mannose-6-phosphate isomerase
MALPQEQPSSDEAESPLNGWCGKYADWLANSVLPLWWEAGADRKGGGWYERLGPDGKPKIEPRRAHIQARQSCVFAIAGELGWNGPWREAVRHGLSFLDTAFLRPDGFYRRLVSPDGKPEVDEATLYDQAFVLLAWAGAAKAGILAADMRVRARILREKIEAAMRYEKGGFKEFGAYPFQSKSHAPLMDAALAWREIDDTPEWNRLADDIGTHCITRLIDPDTMMLYDYYDENWKVLHDGSESTIHPGRHFLWSQLIIHWANLRNDENAKAMAQRLFEVGAQGVSEERNLTFDRYGADFNKVCDTARLWPQTERLRAALTFAKTADELFAMFYLENAKSAAESLWRYLEPAKPGLWHDRMLADGGFADEYAPATALHHLARVVVSLRSV